MSKIIDAIRDTGVFYLATLDGDQPRVRPFGAVAEFEEKVYICTNNKKDCFEQMMKNPKIEISGMAKDGTWIRVTGKAILDERDEAKIAFLNQNPDLKNMYSVDDGIFEVLYIDDISCTKFSFTADPVVIE